MIWDMPRFLNKANTNVQVHVEKFIKTNNQISHLLLHFTFNNIQNTMNTDIGNFNKRH